MAQITNPDKKQIIHKHIWSRWYDLITEKSEIIIVRECKVCQMYDEKAKSPYPKDE